MSESKFNPRHLSRYTEVKIDTVAELIKYLQDFCLPTMQIRTDGGRTLRIQKIVDFNIWDNANLIVLDCVDDND